MSNLYFMSDTHFYHENIIKYENRPFTSVEQMNRHMIKNWNNTVKKNDRIILVGDFCFNSKLWAKDIVDQLNGYKILVKGNHDTQSNKFFLDIGFDEVSKYPIILDNFWIISHEPIYINENMPYANIFGHVHGNPEFKDYTKQSFCVCVERSEINYTPISFNRIKQLMGVPE